MDDIAKDLALLHELEGAAFVKQLKTIVAHNGFHVLGDNPEIYTMGESGEDYDNLLDAAVKAVGLGYRVYVLPNPQGFRSADFIFVRRGIYRMYDLKTIRGKASAGNRLRESVGQSKHVLLNIKVHYNGGRLAAEIRSFFEKNPQACEVLVFKGKRFFTVKRSYALQKDFLIKFRRRFEG